MTAPTAQLPPSADDFLLNGNGPSRKGRSASFLTIGSFITGTITTKPETKQKNDPETGLPKCWPNGDPVWQIVVTLQTTLRSTEVEDDDGVRYLYVAGNRAPESKSLHAAVAEAVRVTGAPGLEVGGQITVTYVGNGPKSPNAPAVAQPPKQYAAVYVPAAQAVLMGGVAPAVQPAAPAPTVPPVTATPAGMGHFDALAAGPAAALPFPPHLTPEQLAAVQAAGLTAAVAWQMFPAPAA